MVGGSMAHCRGPNRALNGRSAFSRCSVPMHRMVGSVAVNLARHSPLPVTIVP